MIPPRCKSGTCKGRASFSRGSGRRKRTRREPQDSIATELALPQSNRLTIFKLTSRVCPSWPTPQVDIRQLGGREEPGLTELERPNQTGTELVQGARRIPHANASCFSSVRSLGLFERNLHEFLDRTLPVFGCLYCRRRGLATPQPQHSPLTYSDAHPCLSSPLCAPAASPPRAALADSRAQLPDHAKACNLPRRGPLELAPLHPYCGEQQCPGRRPPHDSHRSWQHTTCWPRCAGTRTSQSNPQTPPRRCCVRGAPYLAYTHSIPSFRFFGIFLGLFLCVDRTCTKSRIWLANFLLQNFEHERPPGIIARYLASI